MISSSDLKKIDSSSMCQIYDRWGEIAQTSFNEDFEQVRYDKIDHIVFAGMGGSGSIGDIFSSILSKTNIHVSVVKGYHLPKTVNKNSLIVVTSVSGNTEETLNVLKNSYELKLKIIGFSGGGEMERFCNSHNIDFRLIEKIHSPRASFSKFLYAMLKILLPLLPIHEEIILDSIKDLLITKNKIYSENLTTTNVALNLAKWIKNIPVIYYPDGLQASAIRFKNSLQENSKIHVIAEDVIEASHNGIVPWVKDNNLQPILIKGGNDFIKTKERWGILEEFLCKESIDFKEIVASEKGILSKLVNLIYLLDYVSIYKAILENTDPTPVDAIDFIKNRLFQLQ